VKKLSCRHLAIALIFQSSIVFAGSQVYTNDGDFDIGLMDGVEYLTTPNQLQLSVEGSTLPFIWVANSAENTVSKINTETGCELGRYRTGPGTDLGKPAEGVPSAENPSRTTVDINGDVWVGNRQSNTAIKIALTPTDTNGDGTITTSQDTNGNCLIEPEEVLAWGTDEAILLRFEVDTGPRALAINADNNVWIGGSSGKTMRLYDSTTGSLIKEIPIERSCYGALIDSNGTLWISNDGEDSLTRVDDPTGNHSITYIDASDGTVYGIGIDREGFIYTSGWEENLFRKLDPATNTWLYSVPISGGAYGRGVTVGLEGDIWVAQSALNKLTRHNAADGSLIASIPVGKGPTGVATAKDGKIWVSNLLSNNVMRVDPATNAVDFTQEGHSGPYNYSDMTGIISRSITTHSATWTVVYQEAALVQAKVSWTADTPGDSTIIVMVESSVDGVTWSAPQQVQSGVEFNTVEKATQMQIVVKFTASTLESPILYDLTVDTPEPSTLQFSTTDYSVNENGGEATITVTRTGDSAISVDYATSDVTATAGSDYIATSGTLNWAKGDAAEKTFTIDIIDDSEVENNETVIVSLSHAELGSPSTAMVTIIDNDLIVETPEPSTLQFSTTNYSVNENGGEATITVTRTGESAISVDYATSDDTATADSDYIATSGTLNWAEGDALLYAEKTFTIDIIDDSEVESDETVFVSLSNAELGWPSTAMVTIIDNDLIVETPEPSTLQFSTTNYSVNENGGEATITVTRTGDSAISVDYATSDATATASKDYIATSGTLNWAKGDAAEKTFTIDIIDDSEVENNETVIISLSHAELGSPSTAMVTIIDNDLIVETPEPSILQFSSANYSVNENGGEATITVTRTGESAISVDYATSDDTATADSDYIATSGTLNWAEGDTADKTFTIDITDNSELESDETVFVSLSNAELGWPNTAVLTITDNDTISCATVSEIPSEECEALIAIYNSTNGKQWKNNTGWTKTKTPCSWYGVTCSNGHVTRLYLQHNQLSGTIPPEIEGLSHLAVFNIKNNEICGKIPVELMELSHLWYLNINDNHLSTSNAARIIWLNGINPGWDTTQTPCSVGSTVQFTVATYKVTENGGQATITVTRTGDSAISVDYATSDDTASAAPCHNDYTATTGTLNWANGDSADKTFTININDDNRFENDETLVISLSNPTGIELGTPDIVVLTIIDNDSPSTSFDCTTITGIPSTECSALISLYSYTKGAQWRNNTGWKTTNTPCNWYGVTCENGHVTRLNLQYNRLNGTLSWMLESLSQLKVLALNNNQIGGNIPSGLLNLDKLLHINLANNQLRGSIPTDMGQMSQLQSLLVGNNNLHGEIPVSLVHLNNLSGLSLDINHLEAHDPALIPWLNDHNPSWEKTQTPP